VPEQWLCDALWGDEEADAARQVLCVTVPRLRKLLGNDEAVGQQGGKVWLDRQLCWVDAWRFDALSTGSGVTESLHEALKLYAGAFLPDDEGEPWSVALRERLRGKFIDALARYGGTLEAQGDIDDAIQLYLRGIDADMIVEAFHRGLMRCYRRCGRRTEAVSVYRRLRQTLSAVLGVSPSPESDALHQAIMRELAAPLVGPPAQEPTPPARLVYSRPARAARSHRRNFRDL
jgi:DNA-binding SARP family transcriptional activator